MLRANDFSFDLKSFPKQVVDVYLKGGTQPAVVTLRKLYPRGRPEWLDRAIKFLEKNAPRDPAFSAPSKQVVMFKPGDRGQVAERNATKAKPGAQIVEVVEVLNEGKLLKVRDARDAKKVYYVMADQIVPFSVVAGD